MTWLPFKAIATPIAFCIFFPAYFWVMQHPAAFADLRVIPALALDHWIPVQEWALIPYASLWLYVCIASALIHQRREMIEYLVSATFLCATGIAIFWLFPTSVPDFGIDWQQYPALHFLKTQDGGANALPSLHVAFSVLTAAFLAPQLRDCQAPRVIRVANYAWAGLIVYSTIATRQHVFLDALAGMLLGLIAYYPVRKLGSLITRPAKEKLAPVPFSPSAEQP